MTAELKVLFSTRNDSSLLAHQIALRWWRRATWSSWVCARISEWAVVIV